jgi:hypothetical protein
MATGWRRVAHDLRSRRFVDAYSAALVAFVLAVLSLIGDIVPDQIRWAVLLAGVGLLVLRGTIPESSQHTIDDVLHDRFAFDENPLPDVLKNAKEIWIFAPTAVNLLSAHNCELLRTAILNRSGGVVRVVVLDPAQDAAVQIATRQLDDSLDYPVQNFSSSLQATLRLLRAVASWDIVGTFEYRLLAYNPGFSLVAIDPSARDGRVIVEFHGFHNEATSSRMHIEITRASSGHWYEYWTEQFDRIWRAADILPPGDKRSLGAASET